VNTGGAQATHIAAARAADPTAPAPRSRRGSRRTTRRRRWVARRSTTSPR